MTAVKWIVYVYAWLGFQSVCIYICVCVCVCVCVCWVKRDVLTQRGQTHSKAPQSSVLNMRVSPLHVACRQRFVSALIPAVSLRYRPVPLSR